MKDFKWVICIKHIKDCPVTVQDVDVTIIIWAKNIAALKRNATWSNMNTVARDYVKVSMELLKLHKEVFLTTDIFFVNKITFFLTLSRKIFFTAVNNLVDRTVPQMFKAFKEIFIYYLQRWFHVTTEHADGELTPLKPLIKYMPGGPLVSLVSANEQVPEIERKIKVAKKRFRATRHSLPFQRIPNLLMIHIVLNVIKLLILFRPRAESHKLEFPKPSCLRRPWITRST
jgi:hypothetical protein